MVYFSGGLTARSCLNHIELIMSGLHILKDVFSEAYGRLSTWAILSNSKHVVRALTALGAYGPELTPQQCFDDLAKTPLDLLCRSVDRDFYQDMLDLVPLPVPVSLVWPEDRRTDSQYEQDLAEIARTLLRRDMSLLVPDAKGDLPVHRVLRMEGEISHPHAAAEVVLATLLAQKETGQSPSLMPYDQIFDPQKLGGDNKHPPHMTDLIKNTIDHVHAVHSIVAAAFQCVTRPDVAQLKRWMLHEHRDALEFWKTPRRPAPVSLSAAP